MKSATKHCGCKSAITGCTDAEEKQASTQANTVVTSENVRLLKKNITHTYSVFNALSYKETMYRNFTPGIQIL
jgi:hypothetical protein